MRGTRRLEIMLGLLLLFLSIKKNVTIIGKVVETPAAE